MPALFAPGKHWYASLSYKRIYLPCIHHVHRNSLCTYIYIFTSSSFCLVQNIVQFIFSILVLSFLPQSKSCYNFFVSHEHLLYSMHDNSFGPGADPLLPFFTTSFKSFYVGFRTSIKGSSGSTFRFHIVLVLTQWPFSRRVGVCFV